MIVNETLRQTGEIARNTELADTLAKLTGLQVTSKIVKTKSARLFEFSTGKRMVASIYTYGKAKRWADGFYKGRRVEREMRSKEWRYEVQAGTDSDICISLARFCDAEDAFRYVLWASEHTLVPHRVWDTQMETFVDSLDFAKP